MKRNIIKVLALLLIALFSFSGCKETSPLDTGEFYSYDLTKYVEVGDYKSAKYSPMNVVVGADDVEERIKSELEKYKLTNKESRDKAVSIGDTAVIDFEGFVDGKAIEGGSGKDFPLEIGSGSFIDGFEAGLVGKKIGSTTTLNLTFPKKYHSAEYAGKDVTFIVTVKKVYVVVYPELTDDIVSSISTVKTVSEYKTYIHDLLTKEFKEEAETKNLENLVSAVIDECKIKKYPKKEVKNYQAKLKTRESDLARQKDLTLEQYVLNSGMSMKEFNEKLEEAAKKLVAKEMVILAIADKEGIRLTDEQYEISLEEYKEKYNYISTDQLIEDIGEDNLRGQMIIDYTIDHLMSYMTSK